MKSRLDKPKPQDKDWAVIPLIIIRRTFKKIRWRQIPKAIGQFLIEGAGVFFN